MTEAVNPFSVMREDRRKSSRPLLAKSWKQALERNPLDGEPLTNAHNVIVALHECPELAGLFAYESSSSTIWVLSRLPGMPAFEDFAVRKYRHDDVTIIQDYLHRCGIRNARRADIYWSIRRVARDHPFRFDIDFPPPIDLDTCWDQPETVPDMEGQA